MTESDIESRTFQVNIPTEVINKIRTVVAEKEGVEHWLRRSPYTGKSEPSQTIILKGKPGEIKLREIDGGGTEIFRERMMISVNHGFREWPPTKIAEFLVDLLTQVVEAAYQLTTTETARK